MYSKCSETIYNCVEDSRGQVRARKGEPATSAWPSELPATPADGAESRASGLGEFLCQVGVGARYVITILTKAL